ncbi:GBS Bsp-like repeat protein [compost metagenome]
MGIYFKKVNKRTETSDPYMRSLIMSKKQLVTMLFSGALIYLVLGLHSPAVWAEETKTSSYIIADMAGTAQKQKIFVYNQGRLETEILPDNSMIQYTYDANGNLLKRSKGNSVQPYIISTSAVSYDIYLKNVPDRVREVRFPTWTELNGQDDIDWIVGEKVAPGLWKCTVVLSKHGGITGTYITHIYADGVGVGGLTAQIQNTLKVTSPQAASLADGAYEVRVEGVARTVSEVRFPTWTENNGQDDLENPWIMGEKVNDTTWKIRVPFAKHNFETGNYFTHFYYFDKYGTMAGISGTTVTVKGGTGGSKETDISGVSYDVFIYGVDSKVQKVQFPTWTAYKDQDDIEWIDGVKVGNGVWKATVVYSKHNSELGRYFTHIYADGKFAGAWEFTVVDALKLTYPAVAYLSSGFYDVIVEGIPSNVTTVRFPTWTERNGQDDLENPWIEGERLSSTSWRIRIPYHKHNKETGAYTTHIYTYDTYGNSRGVGGLTVEVRN